MKILYISILLAFNSIMASAQYTTLLNFAGASNGNDPECSLFSDGTFLYGATLSGGANNMGTLFKIKLDGSSYTKLIDFAGATNGAHPISPFISDGIFLYGTTEIGGTNNLGTIFKIMPDGSNYTKLLDFTSQNGAYPGGSFISDGTFLYGMTYSGGANNDGVLYKIKPDGSNYSKLLDFAGATNGSNPNGSLIFDGTFLYGMTQVGGINSMGVIFKIMPDGSGYSKLLDFANASNGADPLGSLISDGTFLYGTTYNGGVNGMGVVFKILPDGTGYSKLLDFSGVADGSHPNDGTLISDGTFLYGMTYYGGTNNNGVIFKIMSNGSGYMKLYDFASGPNGNSPNCSLISDGTFLYGMARLGGTSNMGTIFKFGGVLTGSAENKWNTRLTIFPNPSTGIFNIDCTHQVEKITVSDITGREIYKKENLSKTIDGSDFPKGIYFINVKTEKGIVVQKAIIE